MVAGRQAKALAVTGHREAGFVSTRQLPQVVIVFFCYWFLLRSDGQF